MQENNIHYNNIIQDASLTYELYPSILQRPLENKCWTLNLPDISNVDGIILHTQDNLNVTANNIFTELLKIEDFYSNKNIKNIVIIYWNHNLNKVYQGPLKLIEFPTHSFEFVQNFSKRYKEWKDVELKTLKYNVMCLNGYPRKHRKLVYEYLDKIQCTSFLSISTSNSSPFLHEFQYSNYDFDNTQNFINIKDVYKNTVINVVTETMYYEEYGIITEKTLQAFGAMQLPIIIGYKDIISDIKKHGFDVFDDILDNSYDNLPNDIRWKKALELNKDILLNGVSYENLYNRLKKNQEHLLNDYLDLLLNNFHKQVNEMTL